MKIAIIGAGHGGQAMAGHFGYLGHDICLYSRDLKRLVNIINNKGVYLKGRLNCFGRVNLVTDNIEEAVRGAQLIMVATVANAHAEVARKMTPYIEENQIIVLNPGRTFGALEFRKILSQQTNKRVYIAEAQSLLYACRTLGNGEVNILGIKDKLPTAAFPSNDTEYVVFVLNHLSDSFIKTDNIFETSLNNFGCILHPAIVLFNAVRIERGERFFFYKDMTPSIASFIESLDKERLAIGEKLGVKLMSVFDWLSYSYSNVKGDTLFERIVSNTAYKEILAPVKLDSRLLTEDVPTGVMPLIEIARLVNVETPLLTSIYNVAAELLKTDFKKNGRTLKNLGIENADIDELINNI